MSSPQVRNEENRIFSRLTGMFARWLGSANRVVLASARMMGVLPDPTAVYTVSGQWNEEVSGLVPDLTAVAAIGWSEAFQQPVFSSTNAHVLEALTTSQNLLRNVPNEVHQFIVEDISTGLGAGESRQQVIERVDRTLSITGTDRWTNRAQMIATTEVTRAANAGALAAAVQAERSLGTLTKRWNDTGDHRVRETHERVHGVELPLMQPFMVGGFPLMYPSEPLGPPEEVVNCRCDLSFRRMDQ